MAFTCVMACTLAKSPTATLYTEGSDDFVAFAAASIATGRSEPVPGWDSHPLKMNAFHGALITGSKIGHRMTRRFCYFNDGSHDAPKLRAYLNLGTLADLGLGSIWPGLDGSARCQRLLDDGFEGVQLTSDDLPASESNVPFCALDRINTRSDADTIAAKHASADRCRLDRQNSAGSWCHQLPRPFQGAMDACHVRFSWC
jgi:hypothetical protein